MIFYPLYSYEIYLEIKTDKINLPYVSPMAYTNPIKLTHKTANKYTDNDYKQGLFNEKLIT